MMRLVQVLMLMLMTMWDAGYAGAQQFQAGRMQVTMDRGTITALADEAGRTYVAAAAPTALGAIRRLSGDLIPKGGGSAGATAKLPYTGLYSDCIGPGTGELEVALWEEQGGDLVIQQRAQAEPGVYEVQWGISGVPLDWDVLVPGGSGLRLDRGAPGSEFTFNYPMTWEAQFVVAQGKERGLWVWAEDAQGQYKTLRVWKRPQGWDLAFATQNLAPFAEKTAIEGVRWHVNVFEGDWRVPVRRYREWAAEHFGLTPLAQQQPEWVKDIRALVLCGMDTALLDLLATRFDPTQTVLYLPGWRQDGYDVNYPDYTAAPELEPFMTRAHELGFRVMLHVNYFGCDPNNELYSMFEPYQVRDPFTGEKLWWIWDHIKFAYINPASRAWRELFVSRMTELCQRYPVDALHLDQTLCIWNHAGGRVDGLTMLEGNIALHRQLREALPQVALSGEGLNEVTFRHEAFAQRHAWGISHTQGTWYRPWLERAHPVSSYVFAPYTLINGYLGMAAPTQDQLYAAWRAAYVNWGVIPTYWANAGELQSPRAFGRQLFEEVRFFQAQRVDPDVDGPWPEGTLFPYRTAQGEPVRYVRDSGWSLVAGDGDGRVISRTLTGVGQWVGQGSIDDWKAYNERTILGLNPERWYAVHPDLTRDLEAFHVSSVPEGVLLTRVTDGPQMAAVELEDYGRVVAWMSDLLAEGRTGFTVFGGEGMEQTGPLSDDASGASFFPAEQKLITAHPPWRAGRRDPQTGVLEASGTGQAYALLSLALPEVEHGGRLAFLSEVSMDGGAVGEGKTDGVTYAVRAICGEETLEAEVHAATAQRLPLNLDLTPLAGRRITLRMSVDPGPQRSATYDWARWHEARVAQMGTGIVPVEVVTAEAWTTAIGLQGETELVRTGPNCVRVEAQMPGGVYLLRQSPVPVSLPADLTELPFFVCFVSRNGLQLDSPQYATGTVAQNVVGGVTRGGFFAHPPDRGRTLLEFPLRLPSAPVRFSAQVGLRDGSQSEGCTFVVQVTGQEVARVPVLPGRWHEVAADLSPWAGKAVVLSLITDSEGPFNFDWGCWGDPRIE